MLCTDNSPSTSSFCSSLHPWSGVIVSCHASHINFVEQYHRSLSCKDRIGTFAWSLDLAHRVGLESGISNSGRHESYPRAYLSVFSLQRVLLLAVMWVTVLVFGSRGVPLHMPCVCERRRLRNRIATLKGNRLLLVILHCLLVHPVECLERELDVLDQVIAPRS